MKKTPEISNVEWVILDSKIDTIKENILRIDKDIDHLETRVDELTRNFNKSSTYNFYWKIADLTAIVTFTIHIIRKFFIT